MKPETKVKQNCARSKEKTFSESETIILQMDILRSLSKVDMNDESILTSLLLFVFYLHTSSYWETTQSTSNSRRTIKIRSLLTTSSFWSRHAMNAGACCQHQGNNKGAAANKAKRREEAKGCVHCSFSERNTGGRGCCCILLLFH